MFSPDCKQILPEFIGELSPWLTSSVIEIINARIDRAITGTIYLVIPFQKPKGQFTIMAKISRAFEYKCLPEVFYTHETPLTKEKYCLASSS